MSSHADQHDVDKLGRWHDALTQESCSGFPVYAIFLVSSEDRAAHDIFRKFRRSFENRQAGFEHLVIFGQHGVSSTTKSLLAEFGLSQDALPLLALVSSADDSRVALLPLPPGEAESTVGQEQQEQDWQKALSYVEKETESCSQHVALEGIRGLAQHQLADGALQKLVSRLLINLL